MGTEPPILLYLLYGGSEPHWLETEVSILSCRRHLSTPNSIRVLVATDQPERAAGWPCEVFPFTSAQLKSWMGPHGYNHRVKNRVLAEVMDTFGAVPVCLVDGDTLFLDRVERLFERIAPGRALMHKDEGELRAVDPALSARIQKIQRGEEYFWEEGARMINSGVIGLHPADRGLLDESVAWTDALFEATGHFVVEQVADGELLRRRTRLSFADDVVLHYWGLPRPFVQARARAFVTATSHLPIEARIERVDEVDPSPPEIPFAVRAFTSLYRRVRGWSREFSFVIASLGAAELDPETRPAWRETAHDELNRLAHAGALGPGWTDDPVARFFLRRLPAEPTEG